MAMATVAMAHGAVCSLSVPCVAGSRQPSAPVIRKPAAPVADSRVRSAFLNGGVRLERSESQIRGHLSVCRATVVAGLQAVSVDKMKVLLDPKEGGYSLIDVRDIDQYEKSHIPGSKNVPMYKAVDMATPGGAIKSLLFFSSAGATIGGKLQEPNPSFLSDVEYAAGGKKGKIMLVCQQGLRAAAAAQQLAKVGFTNVAYLNGGLNSAKEGSLPYEGRVPLDKAGLGGFLAIQKQLVWTSVIVLGFAYAFTEFFPEQTEKILRVLYGLD